MFPFAVGPISPAGSYARRRSHHLRPTTSGVAAQDLGASPTNGTYVGSPLLGVSGDDYNAAIAGDALRGGAFRAAAGKYCSIPPTKIRAAFGSDWTLNVWVRFNGDPAAAPESEQDYRAALLYSRSGSSPWPVCG